MFSIFKTKNVKTKEKYTHHSISKGKVIELLNEEFLVTLNLKHEQEQKLYNELSILLDSDEKSETIIKIKESIKEILSIDARDSFRTPELEQNFKVFKKALNSRFQFLNSLEIKLCCYFRFGFSSNEIALMQRIDVNDVRFYKSSIKKKLELKSKESLSDFLRFQI